MVECMKVLQINSGNFGSTGTIMRNISNISKQKGIISYIAYPDSRSNRINKQENDIVFSNIIERNMHLKLGYYTGLNGCFSTYGTKQFLKKVDEIKPDIIHLHNLHNCFINLELLFNYIKKNKIPVVWTLHDCWSFTGHCPHYSLINCKKWQKECFGCTQYNNYPSTAKDVSTKMFKLKKEWFSGVENLTIVTPSKWLAKEVKQSFLGEYKIRVINNGINLNKFKPTKSDFRKKYNIEDKKLLLGVASNWNKKKGLEIFCELAELLSDEYKIILIGITEEQRIMLPDNIITLNKVNDIKELAEIYTSVDYFVNPSYEETMGLVTVEALACGTPVIVSNRTAVPEMVNSKCGIVVQNNTTKDFLEIITNLKVEFFEEDCIQWANNFDMNIKMNEYVTLYKEILTNINHY